jgi:integrase
LKWGDVDLKKGTLTIRRALVRVKGGYRFGDPKTTTSNRTILLPDAVTKVKSWKENQSLEVKAFNGEFNPLNMVFTNQIGNFINPDYISRSFKKDLKIANLPEIRFHDLRHGHATMLMEAGEDIKVIADRLGHSTIKLTADTYSHPGEKMQKEASNKLDQILQIE